jgi:adenosylcobinamide kinase/adenosylcobinamide-phosphate guanylyltransferase
MGKNGSGKSAFAEELAVKLGENRYYIATMRPYGAEGASRVQKHIARRAGMGFTTLEAPLSVGDARIPSDAAALLEDVSNLLSNAMFEQGASETAVLADIKTLCRRAGCVIAVTISEFDDGCCDEETLRYIGALERLNNRLAALADAVIEMREGRPSFRKGASHELI